MKDIDQLIILMKRFCYDIVIDFLNNKYITTKIKSIRENVPNDLEFKSDAFDKFISSLMLKDFLPEKIYESLRTSFI